MIKYCKKSVAAKNVATDFLYLSLNVKRSVKYCFKRFEISESTHIIWGQVIFTFYIVFCCCSHLLLFHCNEMFINFNITIDFFISGSILLKIAEVVCGEK